MKAIGDVKIEAGKIVTPGGSYPLNARSEVRIKEKSHHEEEKLSGLLDHVAMNVTGGIVPALPVTTDESEVYCRVLEVILITDGSEYVIAGSNASHGVAENQFDQLRIAIAETIAQNHS